MATTEKWLMPHRIVDDAGVFVEIWSPTGFGRQVMVELYEPTLTREDVVILIDALVESLAVLDAEAA